VNRYVRMAQPLLMAGALRGATLSLALKVAGSVLNVVMLTLAARSMGPQEFGEFALWFNAVSFLAVVAGGGQEKLVIRSWNEYLGSGQFGLARGALVIGAATSAVVALLVAALCLVPALLTNAPASLLVTASLFLILQTVYTYSLHATRAILGVGHSDVHEITWRMVVILAACCGILLGRPLGVVGIFAFATLGTALALSLQLWSVLLGLPPAVREAVSQFEFGSWASRSLRMWSAGILEAANQYLEVLVIGLVLSPVAAGGYYVASRFANVFAMVAGALNTFSAREIALHHYGAEAFRALDTLRKVSLISAFLVAAGLAVVIGAGRELLNLFGPDFVSEYALLIVLSIGTACVTLAGPAPAVLLVTGHEGLYSRIIAVAGAGRGLAVPLLAWIFGPIGAGAASTGVSICAALALTIACRRCTGLDPALTVLFSKPMRTLP
jgi:O-antigen/teichoic acid export membrane protein